MALLPGLVAYSQVILTPFEWKEKRLQLDDFQVPRVYGADSIKQSNSAITWDIDSEGYRLKGKSNLKFRYVDIRNIFLPEYSWIREDCRTPQKLKYEQLKYDIAEIYARKASREINSTGKERPVVRYYQDSLQNAIGSLVLQTNDGKNSVAVDSLQQIVNALLSEDIVLFDKNAIPEKRKGYFGLDFFPTVKIRTGKLNKAFTTITPNLSFDFLAGFNKISFAFGATAPLDWVKTKQPITHKGYCYPKGENCEDVDCHLIIGVTMVDGSYVHFYPFLGGGVVYVDFMKSDLKQITGYQYIAGINVDYKLRRIWDLSDKSLGSVLLKNQIYVTRDNIAGYSGYSINIGTGISFLTTKTR